MIDRKFTFDLMRTVLKRRMSTWQSVALEVAHIGIRVNSIHRGLIDTNMTRNVQPEMLQIPMGRSAKPDEVAKMMLFLASDEASYSTGAEFVIAGGSTMGVPRH
ncbi:hypothetical protein MMA231_01421 [Asticcacaulis sp. MM231]|uniref:SDR family oxidoreductase n=1 Tax=Asticcacaulis sp. MM231 TaxID=3157666 RepID=UPI0032D5864F